MPLNAILWPEQPLRSPKKAVVMLHGWGANAQDLVDLAPALSPPLTPTRPPSQSSGQPVAWSPQPSNAADAQEDGCQFIFLEAPFPHPYNPVGCMWYDLESPNWEGLDQSRQLLETSLKDWSESLGLPLERILLGGFSQGGAMTLEVGLSLPLAGLIVFSGYLHTPLQRSRPTFRNPALVIHGQQDAVVPIAAAHQVRDVLTRFQIPVAFYEFPNMGHEINLEAIALAQDLITSRP